MPVAVNTLVYYCHNIRPRKSRTELTVGAGLLSSKIGARTFRKIYLRLQGAEARAME